jgi:exosome complex component RRP4
MPILHEKKGLVTPGDVLAEGDYIPGDNTYREGNRIYASRLGLVDYDRRRVYVVALSAFYTPVVGDPVIGKVVDVSMIGWTVDIRAPYLALLRASDVLSRFRPQRDELSRIFDVGDFILAEVVAYDRTRDPLLTVREKGLGKINRGQVVKITPTKIPRVIGRKGSMISMLKSETGSDVTVGQNGLILVEGRTPEDERLAIMAIRKIELESHTSGLTNRVTEMIRKEKEGESKN